MAKQMEKKTKKTKKTSTKALAKRPVKAPTSQKKKAVVTKAIGKSSRKSRKRNSAEAAGYFSEDGFFDKCLGALKAAGRGLIEKALWLYFVWASDTTPMPVKMTIVAALGYFIMPVDVIPDMTPIFGYTDDLGIIISTVKLVHSYIDPSVKRQAKAQLKEWGM